MSEYVWAAQLAQFAKKMAEQHRPRKKPDPCAYREQWLVQCSACDRDLWRVWQTGDPEYSCEIWREALRQGLVQP